MKQNRNSRLLIFIFGLLIVVSYLFGANFKGETKKAAKVSFVRVIPKEFTASVPANGRLISRKVETILAQHDGVVQDYGFKNMQIISKGALLADIVPFDERIRKNGQEVELAKLDLRLIAQRLRQTELLVAGGAAATKDLDVLRIQEYKQELLIRDLEEESIPKPVVAPFPGMLVNKRRLVSEENSLRSSAYMISWSSLK
jgi:multidrug efflux pump subunit AcrA (membrane-fusion protein)